MSYLQVLGLSSVHLGRVELPMAVVDYRKIHLKNSTLIGDMGTTTYVILPTGNGVECLLMNGRQQWTDFSPNLGEVTTISIIDNLDCANITAIHRHSIHVNLRFYNLHSIRHNYPQSGSSMN